MAPIGDQVHEGNIFPETSEAEVLCHLGCKPCFTVIKILVPSQIFISKKVVVEIGNVRCLDYTIKIIYFG